MGRLRVSSLWIALVLLAFAQFFIAHVQADQWPSRPIKLVAPFSPGGSADTLGRLIARALTESLGQQVYVENRPGAGGAVASAQVARAEPDGYTLLVSGLASHVIVPATNPHVGYDPIRNFTHIAYLGGPPIVWIVQPSLGVQTLEQFVASSRNSKSALVYGSPGTGTLGHIVVTYLAQKAQLQVEHVPYKGASPAIVDILGDRIKMASMTWTTALGQIQAGTVRPVAITSAHRLANFPDVPTFKESGYPELVATAWFAISGPAGMPQDIVQRLNQDIIKALEQPDIRRRLEDDAIEIEAMSPEQFTHFVETEIERWSPIAKATGASTE